jgi:hypothetical protein
MSERLTDLLTQRAGPCVSIYMPTGRRFPEKQGDAARYRQLLDDATGVLTSAFPASQAEELMAPLFALAGNEHFWGNTLDGMAVLRAPDYYNVYNLQRNVPERAIVADSFHIKPLLRIAQSADRFHVLAVTRDHARLFQGDRYALDEVQLDPGFPDTVEKALGEQDNDPQEYTDTRDEIDHQTQRFFRVVDRAVTDLYSRPAAIPLILASLPQNQPAFRAVSHNPQLLDEGIAINPDALTPDELRARAWEIAEPRYLARLAGFVDDYHARKARDLASDDLEAITMAVIGGRVGVLLVEDERVIPGRIDPATGSVQYHDLSDVHTDDLLDDLAEFTLRMAGDVVIVPAARMPTQSGAAAIYRF